MRPSFRLLTALVLPLPGAPAAAQTPVVNEEAELLASDAAAGDEFGLAVAVSGDAAVIGAHFHDDNGADSGAAYVFRFDGASWIEEAELLASDGAAEDDFGDSVAVSGDAAVIGAAGDDDGGQLSGAAYIFRFDGSNWIEEAKLLASDGASRDFFGFSVSVSDDAALIGAYGDDLNAGGDAAGSAYVFRFDGASWIQEKRLRASDREADDRFARAVALAGDTALIGASGDDDNGASAGAAYIFRFDGSSWIEEAKLLASAGAAGDFFGTSVAVSGDTVLIGASGDDDNGASAGAAYVFRFDGSSWTEESKLLASNGAAGDLFGISVALSGDAAVIGSRGDDENGANSGGAYVFRFDGSSWIEEAKLLAADGAAGDILGHSVAVSGATGVAGAAVHSENGAASGSAYVFGLDEGPAALPALGPVALGVLALSILGLGAGLFSPNQTTMPPLGRDAFSRWTAAPGRRTGRAVR